LYPFVHVSVLELHALSHYPGNRQNDRQTDRNTNRLPYAFAAHAHRGIIIITWSCIHHTPPLQNSSQLQNRQTVTEHVTHDDEYN